MDMFRVACVQSNVVFGNVKANADFACEYIRALKDEVDLVLFPECALTGYCVDSPEAARDIAIGTDPLDPHLERIQQESMHAKLTSVVGFAERRGDALYNSAAVFEPGRVPKVYRKSHLPVMGLDRFVEPGGELPIFELASGVKLGIIICFDMRFPEATRTLALKGADIILVPTNWPEGAEVSADHICIARAAENRVFVMATNRVGSENGFTFLGRSKIIHPTGRILAQAGAEATTIVAELDLSEARTKRTVHKPGEYETDVFGPRRTDLYGCGSLQQ
jgi:predicted amidohydrolase